MVLFGADSIAVEWATPLPPKPLDELTDEERREFAKVANTEQPTLLVSGPFGRLRLFPPPVVLQALGQAGNVEALALAVAAHQIDRLPWPFEDVTQQEPSVAPRVLRP